MLRCVNRIHEIHSEIYAKDEIEADIAKIGYGHLLIEKAQKNVLKSNWSCQYLLRVPMIVSSGWQFMIATHCVSLSSLPSVPSVSRVESPAQTVTSRAGLTCALGI